MKLTYKHLKKVSEDDNCTTLQHADGHTVKIAHRGLSAEMREKLKNVPGFAHGALVDADTKEGQPNILDTIANNETALAQKNPIGQALTGYEQPETSTIQPSITQTPEAAPSMENAPLPNKPIAEPSPVAQGLDLSGQRMQEAGIRAEAKAAGALGNAQADLAAKQAQEAETLQNNYNQQFSMLEQERQNIMTEIKESKIDPERYMGNMGNFQKASTAIGLLLSGVGSGASGHSNMAMDFLQKNIDRDIETQKMDMNRKDNLLKATMQQFGNLKDATSMAKVMMNDIYTAKIEAAAAKSKDPMAQARAQQAIGALRAASAPLQVEIAQRQAALAGIKTGQVSPASAVNHLVSKEQRDAAFKEIAAIENAQKASKSMETLTSRAKELQSIGKRAGSPVQSKSELEALNVEVMAALKPIFGTLSESDKHQVESATIKFTDSEATIERKMKILQNLATKGMTSTPVLDAAGIKINKPDSTPSAKKNLNVRR